MITLANIAWWIGGIVAFALFVEEVVSIRKGLKDD